MRSGKLIAAKQSADALRVKVVAFAKTNFYSDFREKAASAHQDLMVATTAFNEQAALLSEAIAHKMEAPFDAMEPPSLSNGPEKEVAQRTAVFNEIVVANHALGESFGKLKNGAIKTAKMHFAAAFLEAERKSGIAKKREINLAHRDKIEAIGKRLKRENSELEAQISFAQKGRERINERISNLLGSDELQIEVAKEGLSDRFRLARRETVAKNRSESEKTAIAFAFLLTKLDEIEDLSKSLIYIDDPIPSLDSNHIFQVNSIIREVFFKQDEPDAE